MLAVKKPKMETKLINHRSRIPNLVYTDKIARDGKPQRRFTPEGVCFAPRLGPLDGIVIATDSGYDCLVAFSKCQESSGLECCFSSNFSGNVAGRFKGLDGICVQPITNHLIVCERDNNRVQVLSISNDIKSATDLQKRHQEQQPILTTIFMFGDGRENGYAGGQELGELDRPRGVCCSVSGDIYAADSGNQRVQLYDCNGKVVRKVGANVGCKRSDAKDCFDYPLAVALEGARHPGLRSGRRLIVADLDNYRLSIWDKDGQQHITNVKVKGNPFGVCVDLNGRIIVSSSDNTVQIYDPITLELLQVLGIPAKVSDEPGCFNSPLGLCVDDDNNLYVCDYLNHRLQVF